MSTVNIEKQTRLRQPALEVLRSTGERARRVGEMALAVLTVAPAAIRETSKLDFNGLHTLTPNRPGKPTAFELGATAPLTPPRLHTPRHSQEEDPSLTPAPTVITEARRPEHNPDFLYTHPKLISQHGVGVEEVRTHAK